MECKAAWPRQFWARRVEANEQWEQHNPEWEYCPVHKTVVRSAWFHRRSGEPLKSCRICFVQPDPELSVLESPEQARCQWLLRQEKLRSLSKIRDQMFDDTQFPRQWDDAVIDEWQSWIRYEVTCFALGSELKGRDPTKSETSQLTRKITDNVMRNSRNTNKIMCPVHHEMGDEFPWRPSRNRYLPCMVCWLPNTPRQTQTQTQT